ncbi:MAG: molybdenum cofactor biosynthesis protein MoaE [Candidatus Thermoplasmatota archaeon]|jgi:molybdopterin synthase catalytic subunit|nr:molybdenum cofactor biosynthesis protein MoaE [Candidatus Thermoplasmatota archaeon]MCL5794327.1 molybdenum cofactor biosynthesis protein MoaE [Candidatus Thermoplasmatota archaeon]
MLIRLQETPIDVGEVHALISGTDSGAEVVFSGLVRRTSEYGVIEALFYEAYAEMALSVITKIAHEAMEKHSLRSVAVIHRIGRMLPGEASVVVGVSSMHRHDAFAGCSEIMDRVKAEAPIWKKDVFPDGEKWRD